MSNGQNGIIEIRNFFAFWRKIQQSLLHMVSLLNQDDINYTFTTKLNPVGVEFYHVARTYHGWIGHVIKDGEEDPKTIKKEDLTPEKIKKSLVLAFERCDRLLNNLKNDDWNKHFTGLRGNESYDYTLEWILWHLVEHDIHHRAQFKLQFKYLDKKIDEDIFWEEK